MRIVAVMAAVVMLTSCSTEGGDVPTPSTSASASTPAAAALIPRWTERLTELGVRDACRGGEAYSLACGGAVTELNVAAADIARVARESGAEYDGVVSATAETERLASEWLDTCIASRVGSPERSRCVTEVYAPLMSADEDIIAEMNRVKR
jgi:hypothetical protein